MNRRNFVGSFSLGLLALFFPWLKLNSTPLPEIVLNMRSDLVGYRGRSFLETGYVYAPYRPLQFTTRKLKTKWDVEWAQSQQIGTI